jgi:predicted DNA-binding transcriptional regulator AlpA
MAKQNEQGAAASRMLTLTEVSRRTGISMPTLQKYKKRYGDRIPSKGKGRAQRYPENALAAFATLRDENLKRRGRPRKDGKAPGSTGGRRSRSTRPTKKRTSPEGTLTLLQVAEKTGISYPTLLRYVKNSLARLPHLGRGRRRRFKPEAVEVFRALRKESRPGRPPGSGKKAGLGRAAMASAAGAAHAAVASLAATVRRLERRLAQLEREVKKPIKVQVKR